jgi:CheY-like chemotaxis protein
LPVRTALVVDDNFYNRDLSRLALEHVGYQVTEAENGAVAVDMLEKDSFDLMVLDLAMPELSGLDVLREIKNRYAPMSIIVMTANPHMVIEDVEAHVDLVMYKPIDITGFVKLVDRLHRPPIFSTSPAPVEPSAPAEPPAPTEPLT